MNVEINTQSPFLRILLREFHRISERKTLYFLMVLLPIALFILSALIYKNGVLRELPVAVIDQDNSEVSRMIVRAIDATSSMNVVSSSLDLNEIKREVLRGNLQGAFYIPQGLEKGLKSGDNSSVVVFKNTSNLIIGNTIYKDAMTVLRTVSAGVLLKKLRSKGMNFEAAMNIANPVRIDTQVLFNPNYNYLNYLIPGLLTSVLQMIIMISAVLIISSEFTHNTFPELLKISGGSIWTIILGKSLPHIVIHLITALGLLGIIFPVFDIPVNGSMLYIILLFVLFIVTVYFLGFFISCSFHKQMLATELALFINTPAFIFSGFTFPIWGMPQFHNYFAQLIPFTHFLSGFLKVYQMNAPVRYIVPEVLRLLVFLFPAVIGSYLVLRYQIHKYYNKSIQ